MAQIEISGQNPNRCNIKAITGNGSMARVVLPLNSYMLVDSTNSMDNNGNGVFDYYIVGDGETMCKDLDLISLGGGGGDIPDDVYSKLEVNTQFAALYDDDEDVVDPDFNAETDTVWHKQQTLSNAQKAQARQNIGASDFSGNYVDLRNKPTSLSDFSEDANHRTVTDNEKALWNNKQNTISDLSEIRDNATTAITLASSALQPIEIVNHGTSDTTFTLTPNKFHVWGEVVSLNLSLAEVSSTYLDEFMFQFTSGSTATTLTLPNTVNWITDVTIETGMTYQVSIINNLAVIGGA